MNFDLLDEPSFDLVGFLLGKIFICWVSFSEFLIEFYQMSGDLHAGEERNVELVDAYGITKDDE